MPRQEHVLSVFVASPNDVQEERARLEEIVKELNDTWSRQLGLRLELLRWETHAFPNIGEDAQAVINEQVPTDYDVFIGIMWHRSGTPTGRAGSGTIEEFRLQSTLLVKSSRASSRSFPKMPLPKPPRPEDIKYDLISLF